MLKIKENQQIDMSDFPTTRYQGSKRKIIPWIYEHVKDLPFETCLDAFGGTGSVSYLFKKMGKAVTYNDKLKFNYLIGKALIENNTVKFTNEDVSNLLKENNDYNFIYKNFRDIYYLDNENKWIDKVTGNILNMNHYTGTELEYKKAISYYALFQACLIKRPFNLFHRKNLYIRTSDVKREFGNKTTWDKAFHLQLKNFIKEANEHVFDNGKNCKAINDSVFNIESRYDLVYLDPPYLNKLANNETAQYLKIYHFLEGLSNYDEWNNYIDLNSTNLRYQDTIDNDFHVDNIYDTFENLISKFRDSSIVLSYKNGGKPSVRYLIDLMKKYKKTVYTRTKHYYYALNHQNGNAKFNREYLVIGY